ncbi:hypothetical protein [Plantactinospora sp. KLBMP9567]|uniref:hypothetical protein n=1 Tax=Plantactinospora sp. KLBMP9567 TaxID=3085900 RepID=UPI0029821A3D|nr:hypothetical protein [Plantactinospora sp. KLBMP9567]MDW5324080.1 hypothetical protein [Plantactinospora sp. KLBMP9567]
MWTTPRILPPFVAIGLLAAGCTGPGRVPPAGAAVPAPTPTAASSGGPAAPGPVPGGAGEALSCAYVIDRIDAPPEGWTTLVDAVAMTPVRLEPSPTGGTGPARLFAKTGLVVRADSRVELAVPTASANRPWIGWGSPARPARALHFPGCPGESGWLAFAGGIWLDVPACVPVAVRSGGREERVRMRAGVDCPE